MSAIVGNGFMGRGAQGGLPYTPPLDIAAASAAYSIRKLSTSYTGFCMQVGDGGPVIDIGFDVNGYLDVGAIPNIGLWRVVRWYDQSGSGINMEAAPIGSAFIIKDAGVLQVCNGLAALYAPTARFMFGGSFSDFNYLHNGTSSTVISVQQFGITSNPATNYALFGNSGFTNTIGAFFIYRDSTGFNNSLSQTINRGVSGNTAVTYNAPDNSLLPNVQSQLFNCIDADNATAADRWITYVNGGAAIKGNAQTSAPSASNASGIMRIGQVPGASINFIGFMQEIIFYNTDQSANRTTLQNNLNDYFSTY